MQLTEWRQKYEALGVAVAAMTYDDVPVLEVFAAERNIGFPLLSDKGGKNVSALGILNDIYDEDHPGYGIGHPGVMYVDSGGVVRLKRAVPDYKERPSFEELHTALTALLGEQGDPPTEAAEPPAEKG